MDRRRNVNHHLIYLIYLSDLVYLSTLSLSYKYPGLPTVTRGQLSKLYIPHRKARSTPHRYITVISSSGNSFVIWADRLSMTNSKLLCIEEEREGY